MSGGGDLLQALDPHRSVVVEACAGSGKTWLLVSRIVRLLLDGVAPGEILAITFTRKAAREIEGRLFAWLEQMATCSEAELRAFLRERGVAPAALDAALGRARGLFELVQTATPGLTLNTFHGWFAQLVQGAPFSAGLAGFTLHESGAQLKQEAWALFADELARTPTGSTESMLWLLETVGLDAARDLLFGFVERRAEWHAFATARAGPLEAVLAQLRLELGIGADDAPPVRSHIGAIAESLAEYAGMLARSELKTDAVHAGRIEAALRLADATAQFEALRTVFLTADGALRKKDAGAAMLRRFGAGLPRLLVLHEHLGATLQAADMALAEWRAWAFNRNALTAAAAFLDSIERYKQAHRLMDFADLEWHVARLMADQAEAGFLQARLDARYRHILLDEFQDTNPLQWQILLGWLGAYGSDAGRPRLFMVGDPKQSIYGFRRADPRVFAGAADFLVRHCGGVRIETDSTRRNAPAIVDVVNSLFQSEPDFVPFRPHRAERQDLAGRVEILPLSVPPEGEPEGARGRLRDPLTEAEVPEEDPRRRDEAARLAERIGEMVGNWPVCEGDGSERPLRFGDILILARRRSVLPEFERALRAARIPYLSVGRGGLLGTLEAADLTALLRALVTPADNLALAHALRTPLLEVADADLLALAARVEPDWWQRLRALADAGTASPALSRAARLLADWQQGAAALPVHDLLDRIYHEGDAIARYRAAVPAAMWPGVEANLEAYIALALDLDGGRYPSLPRFLDALEHMGRRGDEAAPDEGMLRGEAAGDSVRILTIHGAKGLEAPLVWLIDAHHATGHADTWSVLLDWPPDQAGPQHFSFAGRKDLRGVRRDARFAAVARLAAREELNLLYVAVTRTRQYFFASGIESARAQVQRSAWDRLGDAVAAIGGVDGVWGTAPGRDIRCAAPGEAATTVAPPGCGGLPVGVRRAAGTAATLHGERLHAVLERVSAGPGGGLPPPGIPVVEWPDWQRTAHELLRQPHLARFFEVGQYRRAWNEIEFALADGRIGRIDRLVEFEDGFWVLDYKSGADRDGDARQLADYRAAVAAVFPGRTVRAAIVRADGTFTEY